MPGNATLQQSTPALDLRPVVPEVIDLIPLKQAAIRMLPPASAVRSAILGERDTIPRSELPKLEAYMRLLLNDDLRRA